METYIIENVFTDYTPGLIAVKADSLTDALNIIKTKIKLSEDELKDILTNIRVLKDKELVFVFGGS